MVSIAHWIVQALKAANDEAALAKIRREVLELCQQFPVPAARLAATSV
jgi:glycine/serine hydroxymethyltransferase